MKKLFMGSIALFLFSASIMMFQISCKKDAIADPTPATTGTVLQEGKLLSRGAFVGFYVSNFDGTNKVKINITLPQGLYMYPSDGMISPDHKTIFFGVSNNVNASNSTATYYYACNIDGTNVRQVDDNAGWHVAF